MNLFEMYLVKIFFLILVLTFLTIGISYLSLLIRFVPKYRRLVLVENTSHVTMFGPGWIFLKPYRGRLMKIDMRLQKYAIGQPLFQKDKILYSFEIVDAQKAAIAAMQHAEYILQQAEISDREKENHRYSNEFNSLMSNLEYLTKTLVAKSYSKFEKELVIDINIPSEQVLQKCKTEIDDLFLKKGLQLIDIDFSLDQVSRKR